MQTDTRYKATLLNTVTEYDRRQAKGKRYNPYALGHYAEALGRVDRYVSMGHDLRSAIVTCFIGPLCDKLLKSAGLPVMTVQEARYGLETPLPELDD
jgi:hypothetical protein